MILLRKILFPFAVLYGFITTIRNWFYHKGILKSYSFPIPIIAVGNLSVGGTGKTPQIEYLIRLLSPNYKIAVLSRGYKRKSSGFLLADYASTAELLGDEPFQLHQKFPSIQVAVDANRKNGIERLLALENKPDIILLDDAFQHRKVKAGFYILLTAYNDLYADDFILPTGNLRESSSGVKRADVVVVTKCPPTLTEAAQNQIRQKLHLLAHQQLYFSAIQYDVMLYSESERCSVASLLNTDKLLVAGIAKPQPFFNHLQDGNDEELEFPDHHDFTESDIQTIQKKSKNKPIITTEKDFVRLKGRINPAQLFYLPIQSIFLSNGENFNQQINNYVEQSTGNRPIS
ncbi:tetraacyldisaccharide 4'-kinase [Flavobacterium piscinae]|uniref:Tetraacyldisaccharide 4'-kinase n=1 Tax=Flavobacterium piscinae TaxID=2506424 RepID=A0A4V1N3P7_9FLAO|nr:tetraacyldisaccharide 4'-kinase [Flavobacterium piscinae]RXR29406.1 tetraacyldisaccharide 4'-kinase [Flavobacterium piscinae]